MFNTGYDYPGPVAVRYPRGTGMGTAYLENEDTIEIGKSLTVLIQKRKRSLFFLLVVCLNLLYKSVKKLTPELLICGLLNR
jgi:deoxyxylulose-5-phosphate synthase